MSEDKCICCGAIIPEGNWYCPNCLICSKKVTEEEIEKNDEYEEW